MKQIDFICRVCSGILLLHALFFVSCVGGVESKSENMSVVKCDTICNGDILLRRGTGLTSRLVLAADLSGNYSHVGLAVEYNGEIMALHSVPGEAKEGEEEYVKIETLEEFFAPDKSVLNLVLRTPLSSDTLNIVANEALKYYRRKTIFDHSYSLNDDEKLYCSELIFLAFNSVGFDVTDGHYSELKSKVILGRVILPCDIEHNLNLEVVCEF